MLEGGHEWRAVFEHHALEGFQVELKFADLFLLDEEEQKRLEFLDRAVPLVADVAAPDARPGERVAVLRELAPRRGEEAVVSGKLEEAGDWLDLAVSIGRAGRRTRLLSELCAALRKEDRKRAEFLKSYLIEVLEDGPLKKAVAAM